MNESKGTGGFDEFLTVQQVAEMLQINPKTVQKMARKKKIPGFRVGRLWRFRKSEILDWIEAQTKK